MKRVRLSPAERFVLGTAPGTKERIALVQAARRELAEPGSVKNLSFGFTDMARYVFLVGFNRQPVLFTLGPILAALSYMYLMYQILGWVFDRCSVCYWLYQLV